MARTVAAIETDAGIRIEVTSESPDEVKAIHSDREWYEYVVREHAPDSEHARHHQEHHREHHVRGPHHSEG